mgnify:CR=1 FL=1
MFKVTKMLIFKHQSNLKKSKLKNRISCVLSVFKRGDKIVISNYRGISLQFSPRPQKNVLPVDWWILSLVISILSSRVFVKLFLYTTQLVSVFHEIGKALYRGAEADIDWGGSRILKRGVRRNGLPPWPCSRVKF